MHGRRRFGLALAGMLAAAWACSGDGVGPVGGGDPAEVQEFAAVEGSEIATSGYLGDLTDEQREGVRAAFERAHAAIADIRSRLQAGTIDREQAVAEARAVHELLLEELAQFLTPDQIRELRDRRPHRPWHADLRLTPEQAREIRAIWNALHDALQQIARKLHAGEIDRDEAGEATGILRETAMGLVTRRIPPPTLDEYAAMIEAALRHQLALGITSTTDAGVPPAVAAAYRALDADRRLSSRVNAMPLRLVDGVGPVPLPERVVSDRLRMDTVKFFADGGLSGATAAISLPYRHAESHGVLRLDGPELTALAGEAHADGWSIATHAIGDVAIDHVLTAYDRLPERGHRLRIEHFGLPSASALARASRRGVIAVPQTVFLPELGRNFRLYLPDPLLARAYPVRAMLDARLVVALSSDAPVVENDDPLLGIQAAVLRRDETGEAIAPGESISASEALHAYTVGAARASGDEANRGSLRPGTWADFAVLSANPLDVCPEALTDVRVEQTWLGGELVFER